MAFTKKTLKWTAVGQEPSELKKSEGFKMDESPAPGHFDFMFRSTYEAIEELQQKAGEVKTINNEQPDSNGNVTITLPDVSKFYQKPTGGIPKIDLAKDVQTSLEKADSALQKVTKADVGLGNVDNTSDANKPVSTVQQAEFDRKAPIASPTFTGEPKSTTATAGTNTQQIATTAFVKTAVENSATAINNNVTTISQDLANHKADASHIIDATVSYTNSVYTLTGVTDFTTYNTVRFKAPNVYVSGATFKIGTDVYTALNADFEANEILIVTFDKTQKKVFFRRGGDLEPLLPSQVSTLTANLTGLSGQLKVDWSISDTTNLNDFMIVYKTGSYPTNSKDGTQIIVSKTSRTTTIPNLVNGTTYYVRMYPRNIKKQVQSSYKVANGVPTIADDPKLSPGPYMLAKGTIQEGYFGLVTASEMITGDALTTLVGITQGASQNSTTNWLKFAYKGKVLFVAQKPIRYNLPWDAINTAGAVVGTKQVAIKSLNYKVRLLQGALTNPSEDGASDRGAKGSEWNRLMCAVHEQVKNKNWDYPAYVEVDIQDFGTYFTDVDLITNYSAGNGSYSWCQETIKSNSSSRVVRGNDGVSLVSRNTSSFVHSNYGWRPVLELI